MNILPRVFCYFRLMVPVLGTNKRSRPNSGLVICGRMKLTEEGSNRAEVRA